MCILGAVVGATPGLNKSAEEVDSENDFAICFLPEIPRRGLPFHMKLV